jgi:hypothetical protein
MGRLDGKVAAVTGGGIRDRRGDGQAFPRRGRERCVLRSGRRARSRVAAELAAAGAKVAFAHADCRTLGGRGGGRIPCALCLIRQWAPLPASARDTKRLRLRVRTGNRAHNAAPGRYGPRHSYCAASPQRRRCGAFRRTARNLPDHFLVGHSAIARLRPRAGRVPASCRLPSREHEVARQSRPAWLKKA